MKTVIILISTLFLNFCLTAQNSNPEIPEDFGKTKITLLAVNPDKKAPSKWLADALKDHYKGDYLIIEKDELYSKLYKDKTKFPYVLVVNQGFTPGEFTAGGRNGPTTSYNYAIQDLRNAKYYKWDSVKANYKSMLKDYVKAIEKLRKANSGE